MFYMKNGENVLHHVGTMRLATPRLFLRRFEVRDAQDMFDRWASREEVTRHLPWQPHAGVEVTRGRIEAWQEQYADKRVYHWAVAQKETGRAIGSISVQAMREANRSCEIGYCLGNAFWNNGYMTEALRTVLELLFETVGLHRVQALYHAGNPASGRVLQKVGMTHEGTLRDFGRQADGGWYSMCVYSILESEWVGTTHVSVRGS
ncbi:N-acetyltransferase [Ethanoligenens harbinense]|nr:N-acetyltransferase [Ethanoligenens harbinense YUAN-3]AYF39885.1 N-acetyltransferase [Ethanoligenens harbinense]AYF42716.1 N-acetyltransferase [Ethanoligenens harbinense]QCN93466.1 N-acetyltransferase [Ethanoligenens harbinense]